jgi:hypothetical protein
MEESDVFVPAGFCLYDADSLDDIQEACDQFAKGLLLLERAGVGPENIRYKLLKTLLNHALARKKEAMQFFDLASSKSKKTFGMLTAQQRVQLITQIHALFFLSKRKFGERFSFSQALELCLRVFRKNHGLQLPQVAATMDLATRLASRVSDPSKYLEEVMGLQITIKPVSQKDLFEERDRMVRAEIEHRKQILEAKISGYHDSSISEKKELNGLLLIDFQKRIRSQINACLSWNQIRTGDFRADNVSFHQLALFLTLQSLEKVFADPALQQVLLEKRSRSRFLQSLQQHISTFVEFHRNRKTRLQQLAHEAVNYVTQWKQKLDNNHRLQLRAEKLALHDADNDAFENAVESLKKERFEYFMSQTLKLFRSLCESVVGETLEDVCLSDVLQESVDDLHPIYLSILNGFQFKDEDPSVALAHLLQDYQIEGMSWLHQMYKKGINCVLADEAGLDKTVQIIALIAQIRESQSPCGPFLIVASQV